MTPSIRYSPVCLSQLGLGPILAIMIAKVGRAILMLSFAAIVCAVLMTTVVG